MLERVSIHRSRTFSSLAHCIASTPRAKFLSLPELQVQGFRSKRIDSTPRLQLNDQKDYCPIAPGTDNGPLYAYDDDRIGGDGLVDVDV